MDRAIEMRDKVAEQKEQKKRELQELERKRQQDEQNRLDSSFKILREKLENVTLCRCIFFQY